ncbi:hypothetical protein [Raineyella fluvialis]|uniref:Uncharacterized protein n=1 Tax=Raineyella fluvialis TaxID=2662261 RepID=A0A5Q2FCW4_9ACTN|nr:hypothetical protein [Raineyella fluvialis]QGF23607.1 hypothetical protein Rai3103_07935 [Raineyella fluvialis]
MPEFEDDIHEVALRKEFCDALRGVGERNPKISLMLDDIWNQPIVVRWDRDFKTWRAEIGALAATPQSLTVAECRAWFWRLVSEALAALGRRVEREIPSLWDMAPEAVRAVEDFPLRHVQLAPAWGGAATGKRVAAAVARWRRLAGPVVSRLDEAVRADAVQARVRQPEAYIWPILAGRSLPEDLRGVSSVLPVRVSPRLVEVSEAEAFASVCADLQAWWRAVCTVPADPLDASILVSEYSWVSGLHRETGTRPVRLRVRESWEGVFGRLEEETASGVRGSEEELLVMPAWVYAREEYGDWDIRRDGSVEISALDPFRFGGGARRLVVPASDTDRARGPVRRAPRGGVDQGVGVANGKDDGGGEVAYDMTDEDFPDGEDAESAAWAHPAFRAHFADSVYEDPEGEFAPFGTDEGADLLAEWSERVEELTDDMTVADLLAESGFEGVLEDLDLPDSGAAVPEPGGPIDAATIVVGAAFTLLRLSGRIDTDGRAAALRGLAVLEAAYGEVPELARQRIDLETWHIPGQRGDEDEGQ